MLAGPIPIEQQSRERSTRRKLVLVRHGHRLIPAHLVSRTGSELRFECGRGVSLRSRDQVSIEVDEEVLVGGVVSSRSVPNGLEFGVEVAA